jgi:hypothetical protein
MADARLTQEYLKHRLSYDRDTGGFRWRNPVGSRVRAGDSIGKATDYGRVRIALDHRNYKAHHLAWLYVHGEWPPMEIAHINGDPSDNRIANLRLATESRCKKPSGKKGVSWHKIGNKWQAQIKIKGKTCHLGLFTTVEAAHAAYVDAQSRKA